MRDVAKVGAGIALLANAILAMVIGLLDVAWTAGESGAVILVVNTTVAAGVALYAHFEPGSVKEPVAVAIAVPVWTEAVLAMVVIFGWWGVSKDDAVLMQGAVIAALGLVGVVFARANVTAAAKPPLDVTS